MYIVEERTVGASLGEDNIRAGLHAAVGGYILVLLCMVIYYKAFGMIANIALAINVILLVALMSVLGATLTMPGIAGIVLTMGMAVDANVLIFSRVREEAAERPPQAAITAGFDRAYTTIVDSNLTHLLVALILLAFGSGPIKGFAVVLTLGIITSMFTAITVTRAMVNLSFGGRQLRSSGYERAGARHQFHGIAHLRRDLLHPCHVDIDRFAGTRGLNFGLDFTGGTLVEVQFVDPVVAEDVRVRSPTPVSMRRLRSTSGRSATY